MPIWYLPAKVEDLNEATEHYVQTIERAGRALGYHLRRVGSIWDVPARANVLAMDVKWAWKLVLLRPQCAYWLWVQGVVPEEAELHFRKPIRKAYWTAFERVALPRARGTFFVSKAMRRHYARKYGFGDLECMVMPCVNQELDETTFATPGKYASPSFVYAGSMHRWQCFPLTLEVFQLVRRQLPDARLTVLTTEEAVARRALRAAGLDDVRVTRVPRARLQIALREYKYGFVLREEHVVNAVATPTKVSSYMAAGVIPVTTTAVHDFAEKLGRLRHIVMSPEADAERIAAHVLAFERRSVSAGEVAAEYRSLFGSYFDHHGYVPAVSRFLRRTRLS